MTGHYVFSAVFSFFFSQLVISEVLRSLVTKLSHMLVSECNLRNQVRNLDPLNVKIWGSKPWTILTRL